MELLIIIVVLLLVVLILLQIYFVRKRGKWNNADIKFCKKAWQNILSEKDMRHQIMEADKLLGHMFKQKGFQGSIGDILKSKASLFSDINGLWYAHKMRNKLAHEMEFKIRSQDVKLALRSFKRALKDIGLKF